MPRMVDTNGENLNELLATDVCVECLNRYIAYLDTLSTR